MAGHFFEDFRSSSQEDESARQASAELPDKIDTDNPQQAGLLSKYGIDLGGLGDKLGGMFGS